MSPNTIPQLQLKLVTAWRSDPKRVVLAALGVVFVVMVGRVALTGSTLPAQVKATIASVSPITTSTQPPLPGSSRPTGPRDAALQEWLDKQVPVGVRNLFAVKYEYFPATELLDEAKKNLAPQKDGFWDQVEKSMVAQADQRDKRQNLIASYSALAAELNIGSTIMGSSPKALINGQLVSEGDVVAAFRVIKIEARRIIVEREGIRLEIQMK